MTQGVAGRDADVLVLGGGAAGVAFRAALPAMCAVAELDPDDLIFADYAGLVTAWLEEHSRTA